MLKKTVSFLKAKLSCSSSEVERSPAATPAPSTNLAPIKPEDFEFSSTKDYHLKPLDTVLFSGSDPVANFIKKIELHEVVPHLDTPFHNLWTHAGILVDKSVLPLDCLEEGKLYLYESVFSGEVAGYVYSKVLPIDHPTEPGSFHLGPQIRDFAAVVNEGDSDVGICPLTPSERAFMEKRLKDNPNLLLDLYNYYKDFGYPITNILPVIASASKSLYEDLEYFNSITTSFFPHPSQSKKDTVFCSELVSIIYKTIGYKTFNLSSPDTFTPLALEVAPEFGSKVHYAKENKTLLLTNDGKTVSANPLATRAQLKIEAMKLHDHWIQMPPGGGVPPRAQKIGNDHDGVEIYVARVKIGGDYRLGKIRAGAQFPIVNYFRREVEIKYGHEVLASLEDTVWVEDRDGHAPVNAVEAGVEDDGTLFYVARVAIGFSAMIVGYDAYTGPYSCGGVAVNLKGAKVPYDGEEYHATKYQVLCHRV